MSECDCSFASTKTGLAAPSPTRYQPDPLPDQNLIGVEEVCVAPSLNAESQVCQARLRGVVETRQFD
jgi:hypothetical protein